MSITSRSPLITKWSDNIQNRDKDTALTAYAVGKVFSGAVLPNSTNLDTYTTVGIVRITNTVSGTKPPINDCAGFLQVIDVNHDEDTSVNKSKHKIRQIIYPDNEDESSPYLRVGSSDTLDGAITWSDWNQMGGGNFRRIVVASNVTTLTLKNNTMYEAFNNHTFTLPNPDTVPIGTRIGVEQFAGVSSIVCGASTLSLSSDITDPAYPNMSKADAIAYIFECCLKEDGTSREWILDIEHNYAAAITTVVGLIDDLEDRVETNEVEIGRLKERATNLETRATNLETRATNLETRATNLEAKDRTHDSQISALQTRATNLESRATALEAKDVSLHSEFINQIARQTKHVRWGTAQVSSTKPIASVVPTSAQVNDPAEMSGFLASNPYTLYYYDLVCSVMSNDVTIRIPTANVPLGAKVTFELYGGYSVTITDGTNSESFTAEANTILLLEFEYTNISSSANGWTLLSLA